MEFDDFVHDVERAIAHARWHFPDSSIAETLHLLAGSLEGQSGTVPASSDVEKRKTGRIG